MIDKTPYIIVDNQKILPIERSTGSRTKANHHHPGGEPPFGIVDRVTLSSEGVRKSKTRPVPEAAPPMRRELDDTPLPPYARLTYSPTGEN